MLSPVEALIHQLFRPYGCGRPSNLTPSDLSVLNVLPNHTFETDGFRRKRKVDVFNLTATRDCFFVLFLPSTSLWGVYSETFIHHYNVPLAHSFTRLCMIFLSTCTSCTMPLPLGYSVHVHPALCLFPSVTVYMYIMHYASSPRSQ